MILSLSFQTVYKQLTFFLTFGESSLIVSTFETVMHLPTCRKSQSEEPVITVSALSFIYKSVLRLCELKFFACEKSH